MKNKNSRPSHLSSPTSQSGQAIVFIIGALATAFIFGVLASYLATTSIKKTTYTGQSEAALHAAEAGCRHALIQTDLSGCPETSHCSFTLGAGSEDEAAVEYWATELGSDSTEYLIPNQVEQDEAVQVDLTGLEGVDLNVYWCDVDNETCGSDAVAPALEAAVIYQSGGEYRLSRYALDYNAASRINGFDNPNSGTFPLLGRNFNFYTTITLPIAPDTVEFIRLKPLYNIGNPITIGLFSSGGNIPSQGLDIRCEGTVGASTRTVQVTKENPYLSSIFDYVLFSGTDITK